MKRSLMILSVAAILSMGAVVSYAGEQSPVRIALIPDIAIPAQQSVVGLDFGIADNISSVQGVQWTWIYSGTKENMSGVQLSLINISNNIKGVQYGFYNHANTITGVQLGFVNNAKNMKGIQIGLVNLCKNGFPPVMVFLNGRF